MDQVIPNLWLGDLPSALDAARLKESNIHSIVSVMRGRVSVHETLIRYQINIDDTEDADVLSHLVAVISFIQKELEKGRGVLVHCAAGVSRSATVVAAYLMYSQGLDVNAAISVVRVARPTIEPNANFLSQLKIFQQASFRISRYDKATRMFYLDKMVKEVLNRSGPMPPHLLNSLSSSSPGSSPLLPGSCWRIRCKMCRQDLASQEYILEHGSAPSRPSDAAQEVALNGGSSARLGEDLSNALTLAETEANQVSTAMLPVKSLPGSQPEDKCSLEVYHNAPGNMLAGGSPSLPPSIPKPPVMLTAPVQRMMPQIFTSKQSAINSQCSGYFLEPMKWMDSFLSKGALSGKIICPNKKCNAKLGNYDWAGVYCSCQGWVVPGFCIHRSKVDEISTA